MIVIAGTITAQQQVFDQLVTCLVDLQRQTLENDEGVVAYRFATDISKPYTVHIYEEWESVEALKAHMQKSHMDAFRDFRAKYGFETHGFSRWRAEELGQF